MVSSLPSPDLICRWHLTPLTSPAFLKSGLLCPPEAQTLLRPLSPHCRLLLSLFCYSFHFATYKSWWAPRPPPFSLFSLLRFSRPSLQDGFSNFYVQPRLYAFFPECKLHESSWSYLRLYSRSTERCGHLAGPPVCAAGKAADLNRRAVLSVTLHP